MGIAPAAMNLKEAPLAFSPLCHLIVNVLFLMACIAITIFDDIVSAGLICGPLYALYTIASALIGTAGPIIFSIVLWFIIFADAGYVAYVRNNARIAEYAIANGLATKAESPSNRAINLLHHLKTEWMQSDAQSRIYDLVAYDGGRSTGEYWQDAEDEFREWFKAHDWRKEKPPLPTTEYMIEYIQRKSGQKLYFIDKNGKRWFYPRVRTLGDPW